MKVFIESVIFVAIVGLMAYGIFGLYAMRVGHPIW